MIWIVYSVLFLWLFWAMYVLVMGLYRAKLSKKLSKVSLVLGAPWLVIGVLMDIVANITLASLIFLEPPRELLVTKRLQRYNGGDHGWRTTLATWVCNHLLDVFDPDGDHC
jgi:hypothetical protein